MKIISFLVSVSMFMSSGLLDFPKLVCKAKFICLWAVLYGTYKVGLSWTLLQKEETAKHS